MQEVLPARGGHIVRVEVLDGEFLYAIRVYPKAGAGFNLCPADICQETPAEGRASALPAKESRSKGYRPARLR